MIISDFGLWISDYIEPIFCLHPIAFIPQSLRRLADRNPQLITQSQILNNTGQSIFNLILILQS